MSGETRKTVGLLKAFILAAPLCAMAVGCVNLDPPPEVTACKNGGGCTNGGKDADPPKDTATPDAGVIPDAKPAADTALAVDSAVPPSDTAVADAKVDNRIADAALDLPVVPSDAQTTPDTSGSGAIDALGPLPTDAVVTDGAVADAQPVPTDASLDAAPSVDTRPADTAKPTDTTTTSDAGSTSVTFANGRGVGALAGYGWVTLGSADSVSTPTCGPSNAAITAAALCSANTNWNASNALCMSGYIPQLSATSPDYTGNWGLQVGVNAKEPNGPIATSYSTLTIQLTGAPLTGLRATVHRSGDGANDNYCFLLTPGQPMRLTDFNRNCWDNSGAFITAADVLTIDKVGVLVPSTTAANIAVTNLCITGMAFGK